MQNKCIPIITFFIFFDNITYRRAIGEREIKYHFISRCSKVTPLAQRAIKLTLLTAHYFISPRIKIMLSKKIIKLGINRSLSEALYTLVTLELLFYNKISRVTAVYKASLYARLINSY